MKLTEHLKVVKKASGDHSGSPDIVFRFQTYDRCLLVKHLHSSTTTSRSISRGIDVHVRVLVVCFPKDRLKRMKVGENGWWKEGLAIEPEGGGTHLSYTSFTLHRSGHVLRE